jgi:acyl-CoA reductase-like NAD-dependent aldehyde dehydrogenase
MIQFTGSTATGRAVGVRAAERLIPASLELGGKDAMIVLSDADINRAVGGALWGGLFSSGQSCIAVERIYVEDGVYDTFLAALVEGVKGLRQGTDRPGEFASDVGAMVTDAQMEIVARHVEDAVDGGARILTGGDRAPLGRFFAPTVLVDVDHAMACMREETFGPLLPVMRVRDEAEAVRLANDCAYGLGGSVWTRDPARAERVSRQLETGAVMVNNVMVHALQLSLPMGGWKHSGIGHRFGGPDTLRKYTREQAYVTERVELAREVHWYPYTAGRGRFMAAMVRLLGMRDWRRRLGRSATSSPPSPRP